MSAADDFPPEVLCLFDRCVHGLIDRRGFLDRAARRSTAGISALGLLEVLSPRFADAQKVSPADPRLVTQSVETASPWGYGTFRGRSHFAAGGVVDMTQVALARWSDRCRF